MLSAVGFLQGTHNLNAVITSSCQELFLCSKDFPDMKNSHSTHNKLEFYRFHYPPIFWNICFSINECMNTLALWVEWKESSPDLPQTNQMCIDHKQNEFFKKEFVQPAAPEWPGWNLGSCKRKQFAYPIGKHPWCARGGDPAALWAYLSTGWESIISSLPH